ncbi:MAG: WD40/YVTN/BNR-like repeat-containing protein, partial [Longimicrobiales bacterium]
MSARGQSAPPVPTAGPASTPVAVAAAAIDPALLDGLEYRYVGPSRGGRVTAVAGHAAQPNTFYFGGTGGGVFRTTDAGRSWENITDGQIPVGSIGAIEVAPSNASVIYVATGSAALRSNVSIGRGVYRSDDGGATWRFAGLEKAGAIGDIVVHPSNPDIAFVAAVGNPFGRNPERGVFRTRDGGRTWEKVLFVSDSTGAVDIDMNPTNPDELYAGMWRAERKPWTIISGAREGGIYKSSDGGNTWIRLTNGLPNEYVGKTSVSIARSSPRRVFALIEAGDGTLGVPGGVHGGLYRSDDAGATWTRTSNQAGLLNRPFYYTYVDVDPTNADVVYVNNETFWKSTDGGPTFQRLATPHGDNHGMWINPTNPNVFIQSNDGGANVTLDGGRTWSSQNNQPTAELYQADLDDRYPYWIYAGQQDNTTIGVPSTGQGARPDNPAAWRTDIGGCETGPAVPQPGSGGEIFFSNCKGRFYRYSEITGQATEYSVGAANMYGHNPRDLKYRFQRVSPIVISPHDPNVVYHASQYLHRTRDGGRTWETISPDLTANDPRGHVISGSPITRDVTGEEFYSTLYAVAESPVERGVIWTGANDGPIHVTRDNGATWTDVTPADLPGGGRVQTVEASPHRAGSAYVAVLRYMFDDWSPHIYRTDDYGRTWTKLTAPASGFPQDHPTRVVREDP